MTLFLSKIFNIRDLKNTVVNRNLSKLVYTPFHNSFKFIDCCVKDAKDLLERLKSLRSSITTLQEEVQKDFAQYSKDVR